MLWMSSIDKLRQAMPGQPIYNPQVQCERATNLNGIHAFELMFGEQHLHVMFHSQLLLYNNVPIRSFQLRPLEPLPLPRVMWLK
jgi:hypothetical protein